MRHGFTAVLATVAIGFSAQPAHAFSAKATKEGDAQAAASSSLAAEDTVWVKRSDGGKSCDESAPLSLEDGKRDLSKASVVVLEARKANDGKMHIQMCGAPSGTENAYLIRKSDLEKAVALGFRADPGLEKKKR